MSGFCLYFGSPDECQNCGGSASLGGTQPPLELPHGVFCSDDCADESLVFQARARREATTPLCPRCLSTGRAASAGVFGPCPACARREAQ